MQTYINPDVQDDLWVETIHFAQLSGLLVFCRIV
jgi:hypothetical protein